MSDVYKLYNDLIACAYFTEAELDLVTTINGFSVETLNDCIYARYGFHNYEQMKVYE